MTNRSAPSNRNAKAKRSTPTSARGSRSQRRPAQMGAPMNNSQSQRGMQYEDQSTERQGQGRRFYGESQQEQYAPRTYRGQYEAQSNNSGQYEDQYATRRTTRPASEYDSQERAYGRQDQGRWSNEETDYDRRSMSNAQPAYAPSETRYSSQQDDERINRRGNGQGRRQPHSTRSQR